ncbi:DUF3916 domain-containing protein [Nocardia sp. CA-120079]|uniref:DUF3916 domain-containing protein n=1 Tax=Nocardia sp. CA-120079 TaxID=3239974 RepID=UPI003D98568D
MRRLNVQPKKKLGNPGRHLRRLARWPERIVEQVPDSSLLVEERYWNFKLPVAAKLVDPPYATNAIRKACLATLFRPPEPNGLGFLGGTRLVIFDEETPDQLVEYTNWVWAFPRR